MLDNIDSAYKKIAAGFTLGIAATSGFYAAAQNIALKHVPYGLWNPEAYQESWGNEGIIALSALGLSGLVGVVTLFGTAMSSVNTYFHPGRFPDPYFENKTVLSEESVWYIKENTRESISKPIPSVDYISLQRQNQEEFKIYFDSVNDEKKISIVGDLIDLKEDINPTLESWLVKNYAPIVDQAGIMGVGKDL